MKRLISFATIGILALTGFVRAAQDTWINSGTILEAPVIDATNVINYGTISMSTVNLFDTSNTKNFTNSGSISGNIGFHFDTAPRNSSGQLIGNRKPAAVFHNRNSGSVQALLGTTVAGFLSSQLRVEATNLINQGLMTAGADGLLQLTGTNVNISRSGVGIVSPEDNNNAQGSFNDNQAGIFFPDLGVTDNYWGQTNMTFRVDTLLSPFGIVTAPPHNVQAPGGASGTFSFSLDAYQYDAISNVIQFATVTLTNSNGDIEDVMVPSNVVQQAVFVGMPVDAPLAVPLIGFFPTSLPTNDYFSAAVTINTPSSNVLTGASSVNTVYLRDTLAGEQDRGVLTNYYTTLGGLGIDRTLRPSAYVVSRAPQGQGFIGGALLSPDFFYPPNSVTNRVTGAYAAYSAHFDNILYRPPSIPAGTATNFSGRAEVRSDSLDMNRARMRGDGLVSIQTRHLVSSTNAIVDCENISLELGSTNGLLEIVNLTKPAVERIRGDVYVWSAQWSNSYSILLTNYDTTTNPAVEVLVTNGVNVQYHALLYNVYNLQHTVPSLVQQFTATATNVVMRDQANIVLEMDLEAESFTLTGGMALSGGVADWRGTNAPGLRYFTNYGTLNIANEGHFGDDTAQQYNAFVNRGSITSLGQTIKSAYVELAGTNTTTSQITVLADDAKVQGGRITSSGDITFNAGNLKFDRANVTANNRIILDATSALYDAGVTASNLFNCRDGFAAYTKPVGATASDLLGSTFQSTAPNYASVSHVWPALNFGAVNAGFSNNLAIGKLILRPAGGDPYFTFTGVGASNAMYVDYLDLAQLSDFASQIEISPNLVIYYAAARLNFTPPGNMTPEEYLDGQFGGRLRWVSTFTGPNSSVDVLVNGNQTIKVNIGLRNSKLIDSDGDGIPNYYDSTPFDGVLLTSISVSKNPPGYVLTWTAAPNTIYRLESSSSFNSTNWTPVLWTTNTAAVAMPWSVIDTNLGNANQLRYYRVSYSPSGM